MGWVCARKIANREEYCEKASSFTNQRGRIAKRRNSNNQAGIQNNAFSKEIDVLQEIQANTSCKDRKFAKVSKAVMKKSSGICRLDPFLHLNGTLRVGGRINKGRHE